MASQIGRYRDNVNYQHVHKAQRVFTNAEVKAWPTTTPELVRGFTNQIIIPDMVVYDFPKWVADYTNIDGTAKIAIDTPSGDYAAVSPAFDPSALLAQGQSTVLWTNVGRDFDYTPFTRDNLVGAGLNLSVTNAAAGDFTGGDSADLITVTVFFYLIPQSPTFSSVV
jgi:hypothetical protein